MANFNISQELAQSILNYLGTRPYVEVYKMISGLEALSPTETPKEKKILNEKVE